MDGESTQSRCVKSNRAVITAHIIMGCSLTFLVQNYVFSTSYIAKLSNICALSQIIIKFRPREQSLSEKHRTNDAGTPEHVLFVCFQPYLVPKQGKGPFCKGKTRKNSQEVTTIKSGQRLPLEGRGVHEGGALRFYTRAFLNNIIQFSHFGTR